MQFSSFLIVCLYLILFALFGQGFMMLFRIKNTSIITTVLIGFFVYFSLFQIVAIPMKITLQSLNTLTIVWGIIVLVVSALVIFFGFFELKSKLVSFARCFIEHKIVVIVLIAMVVFQLILIETNRYYGARKDISFYVGEITTALYTDTISQFDPYTGKQFAVLRYDYFLENYQIHSAVSCKIFGIHPLVETKTIMTAVVIIFFNLILFKIGKLLFKMELFKAAIMQGIVLIITFSFLSIYSTSYFFYTRTFEGKTILGSVIIPLILYLFFTIIDNEDNRNYWKMLFVVIFGAFCICMSTLYLVPPMVVAFSVPAAIIKKKPKILVRMAIILLPCIAVGIYILLAQSGKIVFYVS